MEIALHRKELSRTSPGEQTPLRDSSSQRGLFNVACARHQQNSKSLSSGAGIRTEFLDGEGSIQHA
jgi:hypothetical protein